MRISIYSLCIITSLFLSVPSFVSAAEDKEETVKEEVQYVHTPKVVKGKKDATIAGEPGAFAFGDSHLIFWGASNNNDAESSLIQISKDGLTFAGAYKHVQIDYEKEKESPLYNKRIAHLSAIKDQVFVVPEGESNIYMVQHLSSPENEKILSAQQIGYTNGKPCSEIMQLHAFSSGMQQYVLAAVKGSIDNELGQGIACIKLDKQEYTPEKKDEPDSEQQDTDTEQEKEGEDKQEDKKEEKAFRDYLNILDTTTGVKDGNRSVAIDAEICGIAQGCLSKDIDILDIHWDAKYGNMYIGLKVKTKDVATHEQGAQSVLRGRLGNDSLSFDVLASNTAFTGDQSIIGVTGPKKQLAAHKVRVCHTTTGGSYLIVVGGCGDFEETKRLVRAIPLINMQPALLKERHRINKKYAPEKNKIRDEFKGDDQKEERNERLKKIDKKIAKEYLPLHKQLVKNHGFVASKQSDLVSYARNGAEHLFDSRVYETPVRLPEHMSQSSDSHAMVGAGVSLPGPISDIVVEGDAVFVAIEESTTKHKPGVFHSQAIFDEKGSVAAWTPWRRAAGADSPTKAFTLTPKGEFWLLQQKDNIEGYSLHKTAWDEGEYYEPGDPTARAYSFARLIDDVFYKSKQGGINAIVDVPYYTPGLLSNTLTSLCLVSGYKTLMIMQTGKEEQGIFKSTINDDVEPCLFPDGSLEGLHDLPEKTKALVVTGGVLDEIGAVQAATVATDGVHSWIFAGGTRGLAVLTKQDGSGWIAKDGVGVNFSHLPEDMVFVKIGDYSFVKKVFSDGNNLYVLTPNRFDRIPLSPSNITAVSRGEKMQSYTLASFDTLPTSNKAYFMDVAFVGSCVLLGTTDGLFESGQHVDVAQVHEADHVGWHKVLLPQSKYGVIKLFIVRSTRSAHEKNQQAQVYVLTGAPSKNVADVYRLYVASQKNGNHYVAALQDQYYTDRYCNFLHFGTYRSSFVTNGANYLALANGDKTSDSFYTILQTPEDKRAMLRTYGIPNVSLPGKVVNTINYNETFGVWIMSGDFGLRMQK